MCSFKLRKRKLGAGTAVPAIWSRTIEAAIHNSHLSIFFTCVQAHRHTCVQTVFQYKAGLRHAILQCQGFCRVSDISHTSWKMSDPGTKPAAGGSELQRGRKAETSHPAHAVTSEDDSEMAYSLDKCQRVKSIFSSPVFFTRVGKLRAGYVSTHLERSKRKHQTHCGFLVGSSFLWLPLVSWKGRVMCANITRRHIQARGRTHKHPYTKLLGFKSSICKHAAHTYSWS